MLETGIRGRASCPVTQNNTAAAMGSGALPVLATPAVAALVEEAAWKSVQPFLAQGQGTVGTLLRRPPSSGSPSCMSCTFMPVTASPPRTSAGAARNLNFTPSASASATSSSAAGMSSRARR